MKATRLTSAVFATVVGLTSSFAFADHMSVLGPGTANMPNDIHNAQIEGTTADGTVITDWSDFVSRGAGADTVNRYDDSTDILSVTSMRPSAGVERPTSARAGSIERPTVASRGGRR